VFINTATHAPSAAASDARSDDDAMPGRIVEEERQSRRGPDRGPRPARDCDRAPAPPAPGGLAGLRSLPSKHIRAGPPADVVVFMNTGT